MGKEHKKIIFICCGMIAAVFGISNNCVGVFYSAVSEDLGVLRGSYALCGTLSLVFQSFTAFIAPTLIAKYDYRKILRIVGCIAVSCIFLMSFCRSLPLFYVLWSIQGFAIGFTNAVPVTIIIGNWFHKNSASIVGFVVSISGIVGALGSLFLSAIIRNYSWHTAFMVMALLMFLFLTPAFFLSYSAHPEKMGCVPYGDEGIAEGVSAISGTAAGTAQSFTRVQLSYVLLFIFAVSLSLTTGVPQHFSGYAMTLGYTEAFGASLISAAMFGNIFSKLFLGFLNDKIGTVKSQYTSFAILGLSMVVVLCGGFLPAFMLTVGGFLAGFCYAALNVGVPMITRYLYGNENYSKAFSVIGFGMNMGGAFALTIIGYVYDFTGSYRYSFIGALAIIAMDSVIMIVLRSIRMKKLANA